MANKQQILIEVSEDGTIDFRTTYTTNTEVSKALAQTLLDIVARQSERIKNLTTDSKVN